MELVAVNKYYEILFDTKDKVLVIRWKDAIYELSVSEYKAEMILAHSFVEELKPRFLVHDGTDAVYPPTSSLYKWTVENISPKYINLGIKKIAYIFPTEANTSIFMENLVAHAKDAYSEPERKMFKSFEEAIRWISKT